MCACDPKQGKYLSANAMFRGRLSAAEIDTHMSHVKKENKEYFVDWIEDSFKIGMCNIPPKGLKLSATLIGNTTSIQEPIRRIQEQYTKLMDKKAFLHHYTSAGMDEMEFTEADSNVYDIIEEYQ